jgi:hypothetical protein
LAVGTLCGALNDPNLPRPVTLAPKACTTVDGTLV